MNNNIFALLVGVGNYTELNIPNLPSYRTDLTLMSDALIKGLKCNREHIRIMAGEDYNGIVNVNDFVQGIGNFGRRLSKQDTFIFYFSGHGSADTLTFSNSHLNQQSVIDYIDKIPCKNKIVFLDCCYSGNFEPLEAKHINMEKSVDYFAGHGIAIYASSSANELSGIGSDGNHSVFTWALASAVTSKYIIHNGKIELNDIYKETDRLIRDWNRKNPGKKQNPVYRSSIGGTIYFQAEDRDEYKSEKHSFNGDEYDVISVKPLNSSREKRLCAFVVLHEKADDKLLVRITGEIAERLKEAQVYLCKSSEEKYKDKPVSVVWCYFGNSESDIVNGNHQYYTIWALPDMRKTYFHVNNNSRTVDDVYIYENRSYDLIKRMQENTISEAEYVKKCREFLKLFIDMAEDFLIDLQEADNGFLSYEQLQIKYADRMNTVKRDYISLTDMEAAPDGLHDWVKEILLMSGCVLDLSILLEGDMLSKRITEREKWLIDNARKQYNESIERIKKTEKELNINIYGI